ncbi:hypothetical protein [Desulfitobacterium sp. AusDCA]|uniref:hypothetical protein n=1 Tax=Desulfitobacterium sp. AusDCA TaxID=3240383 RepID=UPI003DA6E005
MTSYKEILRLHSIGINNSRIAFGCSCSRTTVINVLQRAKDQGLSWQTVAEMSDKELSQRLFPSESAKPAYKMPDYEYIHRERAKSGVTLTLLWLEYCATSAASPGKSLTSRPSSTNITLTMCKAPR